jgi:hypothetical protein
LRAMAVTAARASAAAGDQCQECRCMKWWADPHAARRDERTGWHCAACFEVGGRRAKELWVRSTEC